MVRLVGQSHLLGLELGELDLQLGDLRLDASRLARVVRLSLGARFGMSLHFHGVPYRVTNTVVEFEEGRLIAWRHFYRHVWRWELEPADVDGRPGTRVTETFDWGPAISPRLLEWGKYPGLNARGMEKTLAQLQTRFA